jgi:tetratricopeptide (TPR) repeat protein
MKYLRAIFHYILGIGYHNSNLAEAIAEYKKAISLNPNYAGAHNRLGVAYQQQGKLDQAIAEHRKAIEINPNEAHAHYYLGDAYLKQGKLNEAAAAFKQATETNPNNAEAHSKLGAIERQIQVITLMNLSTDTASRGSDDFSKTKERTFRCVEVTEEAATYQSRLIIRDLTQEDLKPKDYVSIKWEIDFARPDSYHVTQVAYPWGELDEWVSIGQEHYQGIGLWAELPEARNDELNLFLLADKWLEILQVADPVSTHMYRYREENYLLLEYTVRTVRELDRFAWYFEETSSVLNSRGQIHVWVDLKTDRLAKGELVIQDQDSNGEHIHYEIQQVFTNYNIDMRFTAPPIGLGPAQEKSVA